MLNAKEENVTVKEIYRIKKGQILSGELVIPFNFGIVSSEEGILLIDFYIEEDFNLSVFNDDKELKYWNKEYITKCITEEKNILEIDKLRFTNITPHLSKVKMVCYGKMKHTKAETHKEQITDNNPKLHYLVLEGLKMEFSDITEKIRARGGKKLNDFNNWERDHTTALLHSNKYPYNQVFYKDETSDNIIVEFPNETNNTLSFQEFQELKKDYVAILSFLNGAEVGIRKECTGSYYTVGKVDSEIVITYSFQKIKNRRFNSYIPLNNPFFRSENILNRFLMFNFDNYRDWNKKIDLNSIVFYLNNSEQTKSMQEKVFIQMIAFERLTTLYAKYLGDKEGFIPEKNKFEPIKEELINVIEKHKEKFGDAFNTVKSKIGNLNQIKRLSTTDKMYRILYECEINIDSSIENLIDIVRHKTIHEGNIGGGKEAIKIFYLLDELLREIILKLVKYEGKRESRILLNHATH